MCIFKSQLFWAFLHIFMVSFIAWIRKF
jgi:hypothetical protein